MKCILAGATAAFFTFGAVASAATFTIVGGTLDSVPGGSTGDQPVTPNNEVLDGLGIGTFDGSRYNLGGYLDGASVVMNNRSRIRVDLLGWEASFENSFTLDGITVGKGLNGVTTAQTAVGNPLDSFVTGALSSLDFTFASADRGAPLGIEVSNGDANTIPGPNFFVSCGPNNEASRSCNSLYILYDDDDVVNDNHDDLVVRISAVPLPAGAILLLTGLGAFAMRRRRSA